MFLKLAFLFVAVPCVELYLLIEIGQVVGAPGTVALILITGMVGAALARREGLRAMSRIRETLMAGGLPGAEIVDAFLVLAAGLLLITPGVVTDAVGFALLIPPARRLARKGLIRYFRSHFRVVQTPGGFHAAPSEAGDARQPSHDAIEVDAERLDPD